MNTTPPEKFVVDEKPEHVTLTSFSEDGSTQVTQWLAIDPGVRGQQSLTLGDYEVTLMDGELTIEIATLSGAGILAIRRGHEGSVTITAKE